MKPEIFWLIINAIFAVIGLWQALTIGKFLWPPAPRALTHFRRAADRSSMNQKRRLQEFTSHFDVPPVLPNASIDVEE